MRHVRYAARSLRNSPGFAVSAILTLALGIGANTAIFSVLEGVLLSPLPYRDPDRLVLVLLYNRSLKYATDMSYPDFLDWQRHSRSFEGIAAYTARGFDLTGRGAAEHLAGKEVSASFFGTLGVRPALGRDFAAAEDVPGGMPAAVISDHLWRSRFQANPAALGRTITLSGVDYTVIGVLPRSFRFGTEEASVYTTLGRGDPLVLTDRTIHNLASVARLKPDVGLGQARAEMSNVQETIDRENPATERGQGIYIAPFKQAMVEDVSGTLLLLLGAVGLVLLIACANVANLLLARSAARAREFAVRLALGANRLQIMRQLTSETVLLALTGGALGVVIAKWGLPAILAAVPGGLPRTGNIGLDTSVLLFTLGISMAVGILFGLVPSWSCTRNEPLAALSQGGRGSSGGSQRLQRALAIVQISMALILLTGASLLLRTIQNLWRVDPGFDTQGVISFKVGLSPSAFRTPTDTRVSYQQLIERIQRIPYVQAADFTALVPLSQMDNSGPFWVGGRRPASMAEAPRTTYYWTGPDYLRTMRIPLLEGRYLSPRDTAGSAPVIVINTVLARTYFPHSDPVGQSMTVPHWGDARIIGVVGHVQHWRLDGSADQYPQNQVYASFYQLADAWVPAFQRDITLIVRAQPGAAAVIPAIQAAVNGASAGQPLYEIRGMRELVSGSMAPERLPMVLLGVFAILALLLAFVGIYGVISYAMTQRVRELGIRMALGAVRRDVLRMVVGQGLRLAMAGIAAGVAAALLLTRVLPSFSHLLYGVQASDPTTLIAVSLVLLIASALACYIPARRAASLDPMTALRHD
ncbi:MAG TPA: ABC transporter permease [Bryobacteraceae bacterium]|nr:ABC transporter permease [Bryobacteraceae bacterium]